MSIEVLLAFNLVLIASILSPGPAFLMAVSTSLANGRSAGIKTGFGLATMACLWTLMSLFGLDIIFKVFPWAYFVVKTAGALYLLYVAWNTWINAKADIAEPDQKIRNYFTDGFLVNLSNPKSILFAASVLAVIFPPDLSFQAKALITFNHFILEVMFYTLVAVTMNTKTVSRQYLKAKTWLDRFTAIILGGLSLRLLLEK
jgi:threonine/homoserine/homoserine lactone efflux protein